MTNKIRRDALKNRDNEKLAAASIGHIIENASAAYGIPVKELTKDFPETPDYLKGFYQRYERMCKRAEKRNKKIQKHIQNNVGVPMMNLFIDELIRIGKI